MPGRNACFPPVRSRSPIALTLISSPQCTLEKLSFFLAHGLRPIHTQPEETVSMLPFFYFMSVRCSLPTHTSYHQAIDCFHIFLPKRYETTDMPVPAVSVTGGVRHLLYIFFLCAEFRKASRHSNGLQELS